MAGVLDQLTGQPRHIIALTTARATQPQQPGTAQAVEAFHACWSINL